MAALQAPLQVDHQAALVGAVTSRGRREIRVVAQITQVVLLADRLVALLDLLPPGTTSAAAPPPPRELWVRLWRPYQHVECLLHADDRGGGPHD